MEAKIQHKYHFVKYFSLYFLFSEKIEYIFAEK